MFEDVVIPLDGSESAAVALPIGISLASTATARARVVGIAPTDAELDWTYRHVHDDAKRAGLQEADVEVVVDPKPAAVLLDIGSDERNVLCLASDYEPAPVATLRHSVGSEVIDRIQRPVVVTGPNAIVDPGGTAVVVALERSRRRRCGPCDRGGVGAPARSSTSDRHGVRGHPARRPRDHALLARLRAPRRPRRSTSPRCASGSMTPASNTSTRSRSRTTSVPGVGLEQHLGDRPARLLVDRWTPIATRRANLREASPGTCSHTATCPVLVVKHDGERWPEVSGDRIGASSRRVVVAVDGSESGEAALQWAAFVARRAGAEVVAVSPWSPEQSELPPEEWAEEHAARLDRVRRAVDRAAMGVDHRIEVVDGKATSVLLDQQDLEDCGLCSSCGFPATAVRRSASTPPPPRWSTGPRGHLRPCPMRVVPRSKRIVLGRRRFRELAARRNLVRSVRVGRRCPGDRDRRRDARARAAVAARRSHDDGLGPRSLGRRLDVGRCETRACEPTRGSCTKTTWSQRLTNTAEHVDADAIVVGLPSRAPLDRTASQ